MLLIYKELFLPPPPPIFLHIYQYLIVYLGHRKAAFLFLSSRLFDSVVWNHTQSTKFIFRIVRHPIGDNWTPHQTYRSVFIMAKDPDELP